MTVIQEDGTLKSDVKLDVKMASSKELREMWESRGERTVWFKLVKVGEEEHFVAGRIE